MKKKLDNNKDQNQKFLFGKKNYIFMLLGLLLIVSGLLLMIGPDANTRPDGTYDINYWNEGIFSIRRIRIAPLLIILGFIVEVYAVMLNPEKKTN